MRQASQKGEGPAMTLECINPPDLPVPEDVHAGSFVATGTKWVFVSGPGTWKTYTASSSAPATLPFQADQVVREPRGELLRQ